MFKWGKKKDLLSYIQLRELYLKTVTHCRDPQFFTQFGVVDNLPGRYSVIVLHLYLLMNRIGMGEGVSQSLFDIFFNDMDRSMRENGVGDLAVPKRIKKMMKVFYEDVELYQKQFETLEQVEKTLKHTLYNKQEVSVAVVKEVAQYALKQKEMLDDCPIDALPNDFKFKF